MSRHLKPELEQIIEKELLATQADKYKKALADKDGNEIVAQVNEALAALKVREATGDNDGKMVGLIQSTISFPQRQAWCMDEQQTAIAYAEIKLGITSHVPATESTIACAHTVPAANKIALHHSKRGCLWIWQHGTKWEGHTGCDMGIRENGYAGLVEGNTTHGLSPNGTIERDGGGTYHTLRPFGPVGDMHVIACVIPFI